MRRSGLHLHWVGPIVDYHKPGRQVDPGLGPSSATIHPAPLPAQIERYPVDLARV